MAIPNGEWGYMERARAGMPFGTGPKEFISRKVIGTDAIPFGRGVFGYEGDDQFAVLPKTDTNTLTLDGVLVTANVYTVTVNGTAYAETFATDSATTLLALVAQLNAVVGIVASQSGLITTVTTKGATIVITGVVTLGATQATATAGTPALSGDLVYLGVATTLQKQTQAPSYADASFAPGATENDPGETVSVMTLGGVVVETDGGTMLAQTQLNILKTAAGVGKFTPAATSSGNQLVGGHYLEDPTETNLFVAQLDGSVTAIS